MHISSRTPEGEPNRCPVCGNALSLEPSRPPGDAPCPFCGTLLWFPAGPLEALQARANKSQSRLPLKAYDRVRVTEGTFAAMEGEVQAIDESRGLVRIEISVFGRPVPVELEQSQVELVS